MNTQKIVSRFLLTVCLLLGACSSSSNGPVAAPSLTGGADVNEIQLRALKFIPKNVTVLPNEKINFRWGETVAHNVVFSSTNKSEVLTPKGSVWSTNLKEPGTYKYKCTLHPGMDGSVTVRRP